MTLFSLAALVLALTLTPSTDVGDAYGGSDRLPNPKPISPILFLPSDAFAGDGHNPPYLSIVALPSWKGNFLLNSDLKSWWWSNGWWPDWRQPDLQKSRHDGWVLGYGGEGDAILVPETSNSLLVTSTALAPSYKARAGSRIRLKLLVGMMYGGIRLELIEITFSIWVFRAQFLMVHMMVAWWWPQVAGMVVARRVFGCGPRGRATGWILPYDGEVGNYGRHAAACGILGLDLIGLGQTIGPMLMALKNGLNAAVGQKRKMKEDSNGLGLVNEAFESIRVFKSLNNCGARFTLLLGPISLWTEKQLCPTEPPSPSLKGEEKI